MMVATLRTPDERFLNLPDWPYSPHYVDDLAGYEGLRVHYVDEGPRTGGPTYLCLHGQPTWSYLYRKMIPEFVSSGARVIAPDWLGFGRSDKPVEDSVYTFDFHRGMLLALINQLDLTNITLVVQDWGGILGLTVPHTMPDRFDRLLIMNTVVATGHAPSAAFLEWKAYVASRPDLQVGALMKRATPVLTPEESAAYDAPFPDRNYKAGVRRFPELVMVEPDMPGVDVSREAQRFWRETWQGQSLMAIGAADPVLGTDVMMAMHGTIRNCPAPIIVPEAGHFVQEWGRDIARAAVQTFAST